MGNYIKQLFCNHTYKYYNTRVVYPVLSTSGYNAFQFVCTKCGKEAEVSQFDIDYTYSYFKSKYNKSIALGEKSIKSSSFSMPRYGTCGIMYESPAVTLMMEKYSKQGINLNEISKLMEL